MRIQMKPPQLACIAAMIAAASGGAAPAPGDFDKRAVVIWSDGVRMAGDLYLPKGLKPGEKLPAVLFCAGTGGTKKGTPQQLGPRFVQAGFVFLAFDYRGWGESDSRLMSIDKQPKPDAKAYVSYCTLSGARSVESWLLGLPAPLAFENSILVQRFV